MTFGRAILPQIHAVPNANASTGQSRHKRFLKFLMAFVAVNCIYHATSNDKQKNLRRATTEFQPAAFDQTKSSVPLELVQAIQASSDASLISSGQESRDLEGVDSVTGVEPFPVFGKDDETRQTTKDNSILSKLFGGDEDDDEDTNETDDDKERDDDRFKQEKNQEDILDAAFPMDSQDDVKFSKTLDPLNAQKQSSSGTEFDQLRSQSSSSSGTEFDQLKSQSSSSAGTEFDQLRSQSSSAGTEFDQLRSQPSSSSGTDESLMLKNLDPASLQNMDAATLQKVMTANNISPSVLPQSSSSISGGIAGLTKEQIDEEIGNTPILDAVHGNARGPIPGIEEFLGGSPMSSTSTQFEKTSDRAPSSSSSGSAFEGCVGEPRIPAPKMEPMNPTMIASYPGSGARLSWKLIRAITGYMTSDDAVDTNDLAKQGLVISIKSHYPAHGSNDELFKPFSKIDRSVLLLRNPMNAMPSFLSYLYERNNNLENHSTRAPVEYWIEWRDKNFETEMRSWVQHTLFWMDHNAKENNLVMSYEDVISKDTGPDELLRLGMFLEESSGKPMAHRPENIPCVWDFVVQSKSTSSSKQPASHRSGGPSSWPYTEEQFNTLISFFTSLKRLYPDELGSIMDSYVVTTINQQVKAKSEAQTTQFQ